MVKALMYFLAAPTLRPQTSRTRLPVTKAQVTGDNVQPLACCRGFDTAVGDSSWSISDLVDIAACSDADRAVTPTVPPSATLLHLDVVGL